MGCMPDPPCSTNLLPGRSGSHEQFRRETIPKPLAPVTAPPILFTDAKYVLNALSCVNYCTQRCTNQVLSSRGQDRAMASFFNFSKYCTGWC